MKSRRLSYILHRFAPGALILMVALVASAVGVNPTQIAARSLYLTQPAISLTLSPNPAMLGVAVVGSAGLNGATSDASGSVEYATYSDANCQEGQTLIASVPVSNGVVQNSIGVVYGTAGTFYWKALYSGDSNNNSAASVCTALYVTSDTATATATTTGTATATATKTVTAAPTYRPPKKRFLPRLLRTFSVVLTPTVTATSTVPIFTATPTPTATVTPGPTSVPPLPPSVPEPATWLLLSSGLGGLAVYARRRGGRR